uniref:C-type lectin domain-containing protein n=1 Tax=Astyanax mexicanus TaxID=7994 RepID=A0A3B1KBY2_ASTMX
MIFQFLCCLLGHEGGCCCYTVNKTWYEAQSYCRKNYTDLVSIRDQEQNEAVKIAGMKSSDFFWIGLLRDDLEWADGGRSAYRNWDAGYPRSSTLSNCTQLNGKWQNVYCNPFSFPCCLKPVAC